MEEKKKKYQQGIGSVATRHSGGPCPFALMPPHIGFFTAAGSLILALGFELP